VSPIYESRVQADAAAEKLKTFAQPQRLMILSLLLERGEQSVTAIDQATGIGQPALSQQLAELRRSGMVSTRRQAKQVYYNLADGTTGQCVRSIEAMFGAGNAEPASRDAMRHLGQPSMDIAPGAAGFVRLIPHAEDR
jgi:DNA-binding transcriptional ArsR family regulator